MPAAHREALRRRFDAPGAIRAPGVYDGLSALLVEQAGFSTAFVSGAGISFARFGRPDMGLVTLTELAQSVSAMRERVALSLIVDMDTGFGNALNVQRTVRELERAGASALQMEDQVAPKRCGHMAGKGVIACDEMVGKIRAAVDAREDAATVLIARTDALAVHGADDALERAERYLEAGADALFIEAPGTLELARRIGAQFGHRTPLVYNLVEGPAGPLGSADEVESLGYKIALYPVALLHRCVPVMQQLLTHLHETGSTGALQPEMYSLDDMNRLLGAPQLLADGKRYGEGE